MSDQWLLRLIGQYLRAGVVIGRGVSVRTRLAKLADYLRGWMGYFWISEYYRPIPEIDPWLRRRIRMCFWVQWRRRWTRIGNLLKLGVGKR